MRFVGLGRRGSFSMGMEGLVWYSIVLNTRDRHLSSCYVEKLPTYLPTYLDRIDYLPIRCKPKSNSKDQSRVPLLNSPLPVGTIHYPTTQPTRRERVHMGLLCILEIARSWHNYLTLP